MPDLEQKIEDKAQKVIDLVEYFADKTDDPENPFYKKTKQDIALMLLTSVFQEAHVACEAADIIRQQYGLGIIEGRKLQIF